MQVSTNEPSQDEPLIVDHGDGTPPPVEDDASVAALPENDAAAEPSEAAQSDPGDEQKQLALARGWVDKDKFKGRASDWVGADEYNRRHDQFMPFVKADNRRLREEIRIEREERQRMGSEMAELRKHYQDQQEASRTMQVQTLLAQKAQAESEGDWQSANKIGDQLLDMKLEQKIALPRQKQQPQPVQLDPVVMRTLEDFTADNPVFADKQAQTYLAVAAKQLAEAGTPLRGRELLDEAAELAQQLFPTKFKQPQRRPAMAEMNGAPARSNGAVRTWADLKQDEAKKQEDFLITAFPKLDAKALNAMKQKLLKELPATAFRR